MRASTQYYPHCLLLNSVSHSISSNSLLVAAPFLHLSALFLQINAILRPQRGGCRSYPADPWRPVGVVTFHLDPSVCRYQHAWSSCLFPLPYMHNFTILSSAAGDFLFSLNRVGQEHSQVESNLKKKKNPGKLRDKNFPLVLNHRLITSPQTNIALYS